MYERFTLILGQVATMRLRDVLKRQDGQTVVEYGLVLAFVAIALAAVLVLLRGEISSFISKVGDELGKLPGTFT